MAKNKTTSERGRFKEEIHTALYKNKDIIELLLGDTSGMSKKELHKAFKEHVKSHLFIDDTITNEESYIYYDVTTSTMKNNTKWCRVIMYLICHRNILETYSNDNYFGNRMDKLSQMVEDTLINDDDVVNYFGIGQLNLGSVDIYNSKKMYGCIMTFDIPTFR